MIDLTEKIQKRHDAHLGIGIFFLTLSLAMLIDKDSVNQTDFLYPFVFSLASLVFTPMRPSFHLKEQLVLIDSEGNEEKYKIESILNYTYGLKKANGEVVEKSIDGIEIMRMFGKVTNKMGK